MVHTRATQEFILEEIETGRTESVYWLDCTAEELRN
jgi:hypothetical protein